MNRGRYAGGNWWLELEPDAGMLLKRLFPKVDAASVKLICLQDNPETAADIDWFSQRYPIAWHDETSREKLAEGVAAYRHHRSLVEQIMAEGYKPPEFKLAKQPRPYQSVAAALALQVKRLVLGDDVGIGKTIVAFAMFSDPRTLPAIYVTLTALPAQVQEMLAEFLPGLRSVVLKSGTPYDFLKKPRSRKGEKVPFPDVVILSYSKLRGWADHLAKLGFKTVIFDEAHEFRHKGTSRYRAGWGLSQSVEYVLAMTATPVFGVGSEVYNVVDVVQDGALGSWEEFRRAWCTTPAAEDREEGIKSSDDKPVVKDPDALGDHLRGRGLLLRRTRDEVKQYLPQLQRIFLPIDVDERPLHDVRDLALQLARQFLEMGGSGFQKMKAGGQLDLRLRQATGIAKAKYVAEFVAELVSQGEKVLVYAWHREVYSILLSRLKDWKPAMYTGSERTPKQKRDAVRRFVSNTDADRTPILLMSLRSGAGLDGLQYSGCSIIVFAEPDWSPAIHEQAEGRLHRFKEGKPLPLVVYYPLAKTGSDPPIMELLGLKEDQLIGLRDPGAPRVKRKTDQAAVRARVRKLAQHVLLENNVTLPSGSSLAANQVAPGPPAEEEDAELIAEAERLAAEARELEADAGVLDESVEVDEEEEGAGGLPARHEPPPVEAPPPSPEPPVRAPPDPSPAAADPWLERARRGRGPTHDPARP